MNNLTTLIGLVGCLVVSLATYNVSALVQDVDKLINQERAALVADAGVFNETLKMTFHGLKHSWSIRGEYALASHLIVSIERTRRVAIERVLAKVYESTTSAKLACDLYEAHQAIYSELDDKLWKLQDVFRKMDYTNRLKDIEEMLSARAAEYGDASCSEQANKGQWVVSA